MKKKVTIYLKPIEKEFEVDENIDEQEIDYELDQKILGELEEDILADAQIDYWE